MPQFICYVNCCIVDVISHLVSIIEIHIMMLLHLHYKELSLTTLFFYINAQFSPFVEQKMTK